MSCRLAGRSVVGDLFSVEFDKTSFFSFFRFAQLSGGVRCLSGKIPLSQENTFALHVCCTSACGWR